MECFDYAYNLRMARGWESKSVEAQQAEATAERQNPRQKLTPEQAARTRELEGLKTARAGIARQMGDATPRYRALLAESLKELERRIEQLSRV